jgi:hypothetical protein
MRKRGCWLSARIPSSAFGEDHVHDIDVDPSKHRDRNGLNQSKVIVIEPRRVIARPNGNGKMNSDMGRSTEAFSTRHNGGSGNHGSGWRRQGEPWKLVEVLAMVLGFIVWWPIGLAILGWKIWQRKSGYEGDLVSFGKEKWQTMVNRNWACAGRGPHYSPRGFASGPGAHWGMSPTGNRAFDDWRAAELARLEEERQKLIAAEREFAEFMENLRRARDREEFERFMNERRANPPREGGGETAR